MAKSKKTETKVVETPPPPPAAPKKYPQLMVSVCGDPSRTGVSAEQAAGVRKALSKVAYGLVDYRGPLTEEDLKQILGWEEEVEGGPKFGEDYTLQDRYGKKIRLKNNPINRPFYTSNTEGIVQEILTRHWQMNGETLIVGDMGNVLDGQHTGAALVLANQDVRKDPDKWKHTWPEGHVTLDKIVVYGVSEDDRVVNTINTGKARSLSDVIYRSPVFVRLPEPRRQLASRVLDYAVKRLWIRTGVHHSSVAPRRTHSEAMDFIERHKTLLQFVKHVMDEDQPLKKKKEDKDREEGTATLGDYLPLGYSAAVLYLMAASATPYLDYYGSDPVGEKAIDWVNKKKAMSFFSKLARDPSFDAVRVVLAEINDSPQGWGRVSEKDYVIVSAWKRFLADQPIREKDVRPEYLPPDGRGNQELKDTPTVGGRDGDTLLGIDLGNDSSKPKADPEAEESAGVEARKAEVLAAREAAADPIASIRRKYKTVEVFLVQGPDDLWYVRGAEADVAADPLRLVPRTGPGGSVLAIAGSDVDAAVKKLNEAGLVAATAADDGEGGWWVEVSRP